MDKQAELFAKKYHVPVEQITKGAQEEWGEHGVGKFKVLNNKSDAIKVALAHLVKNPHYYSKE